MVSNCICLNKLFEAKMKRFKDISNLYKVCLFRNGENYDLQYTWEGVSLNGATFNVELWGKQIGNKNNINYFTDKIENCDKRLYGNIAFILKDVNGSIENFTTSNWDIFYKYIISNHKDDSSIGSDDDYILSDEGNSTASVNNENEDLQNVDNVDNINIELSYEPYYYSSCDEQ